MNQLIEFLRSHGTKVLGAVSGTVGVIAATSGVIPAKHLPYWMLANGLLTFYRGFFNSSQQ